jgi:hypothetical protein
MAADEREDLADGIEHLQTAAKEMIRATRSLLDAAEGLVDDPAALQGLIGTFSSLAAAAANRFRTDAPAGGDDGDEGHVQPIKLS